MNSELSLFLDHLRDERGLTANTLDGYRRDLNDLLAALAEQRVEAWEQVKPHHLNGYLMRLRQLARASATLSRRIVSIRSFFQYLHALRLITANPALALDAPKTVRRPPRVLSEADVGKLLEAPRTDHPAGIRDRAMLEVLYATGVRVSELVSLDVGDVRTELGLIACVSPGGKERLVPIGSLCAEWMVHYLKEARPRLVRESKPDSALFLSHVGTRMTRQGFWKLIKRIARDAGVDEAITPHTLRHSFAAHLLAGGADLRSVQEMMGHADMSSTQIYQPAPKTRLKDIYDRAHPRSRQGM